MYSGLSASMTDVAGRREVCFCMCKVKQANIACSVWKMHDTSIQNLKIVPRTK